MAPEVLIFFEACLLGAALGVLYDAFRILRLAFPNGRVLIFFEDVLFFFIVTIASFSFVLMQTGGVLRVFMLIGELLGAVLYFFTLSILIMKAAAWIIRAVKAVMGFLYRITLRPLIRLFCVLGRNFQKPIASLWKKIKNPVLNHKKHLKPQGDLVYNDDMSHLPS